MFKLLFSFLLIASLTFAQLFDWEWQNPQPTGADHNDAIVINANNFMLFGNGGSFLKSTDGGNTWNIKYIDPLARDIYSATNINENIIFAVGTGGLFMKTTDGGETWTEAHSGLTITLWDVEFADANLGVVVGATGKIFRTTDGGTTWNESSFGTATIYKAHFIDNSIGYIGSAATTGRLIKTTDGGVSWFDVTSSVTNLTGTVRGIHFVDVNIGYISNSAGRIFKTTDAGTTWTQQTDIGTTTTIYEVKFVNANDGVAITTAGRIMKTTDGGAYWSIIPTAATKNLYGLGVQGIQSDDTKTTYAVLVGGDAGTILISSDGGTNWNLGFNSPSQEQLLRASFPTANIGYVVGGSITSGASFGDVLKTTDGGNTWFKLPFDPGYRIYSVFFLDENNGYVGSQGPTGLYKTTDGGLTWASLNTNTGVSSSILYDIDFINPDLGFVCYASGQVARTSNGGATWTSVSSGWSSAAIYDMHIVSLNSIYILGPGGRVSRSTDGGNTFIQLGSLSTITLYSIYFVSADTGFIAGSSGKLYKTTDGTTFNEIPSPTVTTNYVIRFVDSQTGWLGASGGDVFFTTDGGVSWTKARTMIGSSQSTRDIQIKDGRLWLIGTDGMIMRGFADPYIPVELISFNAAVSEGVVNLTWSTASETNNKGFEVERSEKREARSEKWTTVGFVAGIGTSTETNSYSFVDKNINAGKYTYRLKQIDYDGSFSYSKEIEVDVTIPDEFALYQNYPNPFNPVTTIKFSVPSNIQDKLSDVKLSVFDILGREVVTLVNEQKEPGVYEVTFNAAKFASGMYVYKLQAGSFVELKKMVLLK